jgi:hypothetical protein
VAHKRVVSVKGEREGELYLDTELAPGTSVVSQGRAVLNDNDRVLEQSERAAAAPAASTHAKRGAAKPREPETVQARRIRSPRSLG